MGVFEREQEKVLFEVKEFLVSIIGNAPYGIIAFDLEGEVILTNVVAIEYLGKKMSVNKAVGKNVLELIEDIPRLSTTVENCLEKGREAFDLPPVQINKQFMAIRALNFKRHYPGDRGHNRSEKSRK